MCTICAAVEARVDIWARITNNTFIVVGSRVWNGRPRSSAFSLDHVLVHF